MADAHHNEKTPNRYHVGDETPKGIVACVMVSRHPKGSRYRMIDGSSFTEWQIDDVPEPPVNTRIKPAHQA